MQVAIGAVKTARLHISVLSVVAVACYKNEMFSDPACDCRRYDTPDQDQERGSQLYGWTVSRG